MSNRSKIKSDFLGSVLTFVLTLYPLVLSAQSWQSIAQMHDKRIEASAVPLPDGRVIVAGGHDDGKALTSAEIYDPPTNTWTLTAPMHEGRWRYPLILLPDGRVMAAGGLTDMGVRTTSGVEIYDVKTNVWTQMNAMLDPRENFPLLVLPDGEVFICGGLNANVPVYLGSTEIFDPATNSYKRGLASMPTAVFGPHVFYDSIHNAILLQGGSYNGVGGTYPPLLQIFDIAANSWHLGPNSGISHDGGFNVEMSDGAILCIAGRTGSYTCTDSIEILIPPYNTWVSAGDATSKRWSGCAVVSGTDSVLVIGGDNTPGNDPGPNQFDSTNWYFYREHLTTQGPRMISHRGRFTAALSQQPTPPCGHNEVVYVFGGISTGHRALDSCEKLPLGLKGAGGIPTALSLPVRQQAFLRTTCIGPVDTTVPLAIIGCLPASAMLDSLWIDGSSTFIVSDSRSVPRVLAVSDSIRLSYVPGARLADTARLHIRYNLGSGMRDTTITLLGASSSLFFASRAYQHLAIRSGSQGQQVTMPLTEDIGDSVYLKSSWGNLTSLTATFSFDSSKVTFKSVTPPAGWSLGAVTNRGNNVTYVLTNVSSSPTRPLNMGEALFTVKSTLPGMTLVVLNQLLLHIGQADDEVCLSTSEDEMWGIEVIPPSSGVLDLPSSNSIRIRPNPFEDHIAIDDPSNTLTSVEILDVLGRSVQSETIHDASEVRVGTLALQPGTYVVICHARDQVQAFRITKSR